MLVIAKPELLPDSSLRDQGSQVFSPPSAGRISQEALCYKVIIHIHSVEDFSAATERHLPFDPSSDDSGRGGLPDSDSDESGPRRHSFATFSGLVDGITPSPVAEKEVVLKADHF